MNLAVAGFLAVILAVILATGRQKHDKGVVVPYSTEPWQLSMPTFSPSWTESTTV